MSEGKVIDIVNVSAPAEPPPEMESQVKPLHDNVFIRLDAREEVRGGIIIPDQAQNKRQEGTVVAVGPGKFADNGELIPCSVFAGDRVLLPKWGGSEEKIHGVSYSVVKNTDILCIIVPVNNEEV